MDSKKRELSQLSGVVDAIDHVEGSVDGDKNSANKRQYTGDLLDDTKLYDLLGVISTIASLSPMHKGLCWLGQVYALSKRNKTWVDCALERLREERLVRIFHTSNLGVAMMLNETYINEVRLARIVATSPVKDKNDSDDTDGHLDAELGEALSKFIALLEKSSMCSVTLNELESEYDLKKEEVLKLKLCGFLLNRRDVDAEEVYWIYWPCFASVITDLTQTRSRLIAAIKRSRSKEVPVSVLEGLVLRGKKKNGAAGRTTTQYYTLDLVGSRKVREILTPGGKIMFRLV